MKIPPCNAQAISLKFPAAGCKIFLNKKNILSKLKNTTTNRIALSADFKEKKLVRRMRDAPQVLMEHQETLSSNPALAYGHSISFPLKNQYLG